MLVLGHSSFIGKRIADALRQRCEVTTAGRRDNADFLLDLEDPKADLTNFGSVDVIVHCAASFMQNNIDDFIHNERVNSLGSFTVGRLAAAVKCKQIIYLSSISAIDDARNKFFGSYGLSKKHGEENLHLVANLIGCNFVSLRLSQIYDEKQEARVHQSFLYDMLNKVSRGTDVTIYGKKDPLRNYLHVDDVARIIEKTIGQNLSGIFTCAHPSSHRFGEIARLAFDIYGTQGNIIFDESKPDIDSLFVPDDKTLFEQIAFYPLIDMYQGITMIRDFAMSTPPAP